MEIKTVSLPGGGVTLYALLLALGVLSAALFAVFSKRAQIKWPQMALYCLVSIFLSLFLGRLVYCLVQFDWIFYDFIGEYLGLSPFFDLSTGSVNVIGVLVGCMLSGLLTASAVRGKAYSILDAAAVPGLCLFAFARLLEPLSGQGFGDAVESESLQFFPVMLENGAYAVCFLEALLAIAIALFLTARRKHYRRKGTLFLTALTLLSVSQIIPESLRRDDYLTIFTFARVNQIGYALFLGLALLLPLLEAAKHGTGVLAAIGEFGLLLLGVCILIAGEFALDKTFISHLLIYAVMLVTLILMAALILRRIGKEDRKHKHYT